METSFYTDVEFPTTINLLPSQLHSGIYDELEKAVKKLEGTCVPKIGFIKKGSVQVIKKQIGRSEGAHFTGNVTFRLQLRCSAAMPMVGQIIPCMVTSKNELGVLATNYQLPAYTMFILKMPDSQSDALDRIQRNTYIEAKVLAFALKASNQTERTNAEFWIVCSLSNTQTSDTRYQILPPVSEKPDLMANNHSYDLQAIDDKRKELTDGHYEELEVTKKSIKSIRSDYIDMMLNLDDKQVINDIFLSSLLGKHRKNFIVGKLDAITDTPNNKRVHHDVTVLYSDIATLNKGDKIIPEVIKTNESICIGSIILYRNYQVNNFVASRYSNVDFWGRHVKYVINKSEMIYANGQYLSQLTEMFTAKSKSVKFKIEGNKKTFTENGKPMASLVIRDKHVMNRAYYKMRELISFFGNEIFPRHSMKIACVAECPGGFIQGLLDQRVYPPNGTVIDTGIRDDITTVSIGINCAPWKQLEALTSTNYSYVNLRCDGPECLAYDPSKTNLLLIGGTQDKDDTTGDILNADVRDRFCSEFETDKADLITGDAGIERDKAETTEEMDTHRLLLAEIIIALRCQKSGGSFILKIYDMATEFTMNMLQVLSYCYEEIGLFKPETSRAASSEKYLICKRLQVNDDDRMELISSLDTIIQIKPINDDNTYAYYGNMVTIPNQKLQHALVSYNSYYMKKQISFIEDGRGYAALYNNSIQTGNVDEMVMDIMGKVGNQVLIADEFFDKM